MSENGNGNLTGGLGWGPFRIRIEAIDVVLAAPVRLPSGLKKTALDQK